MSKDYNITALINAIKAVCAERNIKLGEFERKIGLATGALSRVANGALNLKVTTLIAIADELDMFVDDLFFFDFEAHRKAQVRMMIEQKEAEIEALKAELENK